MSVIDDYLAKVDPGRRAELERVRKIVKESVPGVEEGWSYAMPTFNIGARGYWAFWRTNSI